MSFAEAAARPERLSKSAGTATTEGQPSVLSFCTDGD